MDKKTKQFGFIHRFISSKEKKQKQVEKEQIRLLACKTSLYALRELVKFSKGK
jgi:hypothetical protein